MSEDPSIENSTPTSTGLEPNTAAGIAAVLGLLGGPVFLFAEKKNQYVRRWASQLTVLWVGIFAILFVLLLVVALAGAVIVQIPFVRDFFGILWWLFSFALSAGMLALWLFTIVKAFGGKEIKIPVVDDYAAKLLAKFPSEL